MWDIFNKIFSFSHQWLGSSLLQIVAQFSGVLLCTLVIEGIWSKRLKLNAAVLCLLPGLLLASVAFHKFFVNLLKDISFADGVFVTIGLPGVLILLSLQLFFSLYLVCLLIKVSLKEVPDKNSSLSNEKDAEDLNEKNFCFSHKLNDFLYKYVFYPPGLPQQKRLRRGATIVVPIIIITATVLVFSVGMHAPQVMIGDEVTHFYMLTAQADELPEPNFFSRIPTNWGGEEVRRYPHSFLWHYLGGIIYKYSGGSFAAIQLYQALFFAQLLTSAYLLARRRSGVESRSAILYLLVLASLPISLIFSVAFYQDVPMTAQVVTAFALLDRKHWFAASFFLCFGLCLKVTAIIFMPVFLLVFFVRSIKWHGSAKAICYSLLVLFLFIGTSFFLGKVIKKYAQCVFYPVLQVERIINKTPQLKKIVTSLKKEVKEKKRTKKAKVFRKQKKIIVNYPGDLRNRVNYFVYGGLLLWLVIAAGLLQPFFHRFLGRSTSAFSHARKHPSWWLVLAGGWYTVIVAVMLIRAPDARFFLPGLLLLLLPLTENVVRLPKPRLLLSIFTALAIIQAGYVSSKVYNLRQVPPPFYQTIDFLTKNLPQPARVFMYPEGNYRLFPVPHEWYLDYQLREFWRADNTERIEMLHRYNIGAIVIKKNLIASVDERISNLGVYPKYFVRELKNDKRFVKIFDNSYAIVYLVPQ